MTTAIAVYNSDGCVGRCDARCHNATSPDCDCICGGRLHGIGATNAIAENTRHHLGDNLTAALRAFAERRGHDPGALRAEVTQPTLFEDAAR